MTKKVAIIGHAFRFPACTTQTYWPNLLAGKDLVTKVDASRWEAETLLHPSKSHPGTSYTYAAGSIGDVASFDAGFFGISPREAALMDPQQRLLLELSQEAFENAGVTTGAVKASKTGVFIGIASTDYAYRLADDLAAIDASVATGNTQSIAANRISFMFDLRGPSMAIDTACSSSLVAFHQACQSILSGESVQALAGGVSLHLHPYGFITFSKASMLSPRGRCNVFDADGDGYVRSEGGGIFLLKDYDAALAEGNHILAVVAHSAVNTDGRKSGLTVPSADAQIALLTEAYAQAHIEPDDIDYIEAHGTGTAVGDPIETRAIGMALGKRRRTGKPLWIGSVKSNMGHLEAASGVAGLVKVLHCIQSRSVPATIGIKALNPNIPFKEWNLEVVTENRPLKKSGKIVAGINSFGFGGANAHVILESYQSPTDKLAQPSNIHDVPIALTAKAPDALRDAAADLAQHIEAHSHTSLYDTAYHLSFNRDWHEHRAIFFAHSLEHALAELKAYASDGNVSAIDVGSALPNCQGPAFIYSGNGSQWVGMGRGLLDQDVVFRNAVREVDALFQQHADWSIEAELRKLQDHKLEFTEIAQPALFALQVGVTRMLEQRGITPVAVAGHSVGEVAAAWACGALSLASAVQVIYQRSLLQGRTKGAGKMAAVGLDVKAAEALITQLGLSSTITIAVINSANSVTLAGEPAGLAQIEMELRRHQQFYKLLELDYAFHSKAMDSIENDLVNALSNLRPTETRIPYYSTVNGECIDGRELNARYWWHNIRLPVLFADAISNMQGKGINTFIEIGPHAVLRAYLNEALKSADLPGRVITTLGRNDDSAQKVGHAVNQAMIAGCAVNWPSLLPYRGRFVTLPNYPWQRERCWHPVTTESGGLLTRKMLHPLLGYRIESQDWMWESRLDPVLNAMLADHVVGDAVILPGSAYIELALAAASAYHPAVCLEIESLEIHAPLTFAESGAQVIRTTIDVADGAIKISSRSYVGEHAWIVHATARVWREAQSISIDNSDSTARPERGPDFSGAHHTHLTIQAGLRYGPAFRAIQHGWVEGDTVWALLEVPDAIKADMAKSHLHPALLDCTFQLIIQLLQRHTAVGKGTYVPIKAGRIRYQPTGHQPHIVQATLLQCTRQSVVASFRLSDQHGNVIAHLEQVRFRSVQLQHNAVNQPDYIEERFVPMPHALASLAMGGMDIRETRSAIFDAVRRSTISGTQRRYVDEIEPLLDEMCSRFGVEALQAIVDECGLVSAQKIAHYHGAHPEKSHALNYVLEMAAQDGLLERTAEGYGLTPSDGSQPGALDIWNSLITDYPDCFEIIHDVGRTGYQLIESITSAQHANDAQADDGRQDYSSIANVLGMSSKHQLGVALRKIVEQAYQQLRAGERLHVMELVNAKPLFAADLCAALDSTHCNYDVVALKEAALQEAMHLQEQFSFIRASLLSSLAAPDRASAEQNAKQNAKTVQLAIVVLDFSHLADARLALDMARARLAPGGTLMIVGLHPARWIDFISHARSGEPYSAVAETVQSAQRPASYWLEQLAHCGLETAAEISFSSDMKCGPYILLAKASNALPANVSTALAATSLVQRGWLLLFESTHQKSELIPNLVTQLERVGDKVATLAFGERHLIAETLENYRLQWGYVPEVLYFACDTESAGHVIDRSMRHCLAAYEILQACNKQGEKQNYWIITSGANGRAHSMQAWPSTCTVMPEDALLASALWGWARVMANESMGAVSIKMLDIPGIDDVMLVEAIIREIRFPNDESELMLTREGGRFVSRLELVNQPTPIAVSEKDSQHAETISLGFDVPGQLRHLRWEAHPRRMPAENEVEIEVHATGLNFRDIMYVLGMLPEEAIENGFAGATLGLEFSGIILSCGKQVTDYAPGDRVVGFGPSSFANRVVTSTSALSHIPRNLTFEAAATIPSTFFTVYYALQHLAHIEPGESVLIHGAAGGVGLAAIQIAKWRGAVIHATAGSAIKRQFLKMLGVQYIYDSRSLTYADDIMSVTQGAGIDIVLNTLAGEAINRNLHVLKPFGRFIELGKRDFYENTKIGLRPFRNNISYFGVDADQLMNNRPALTSRLFGELMKLFDEGVLHPLPYHVFEAGNIVDAFRYMQQSKQIGKVVVTYHNPLVAGIDALSNAAATAREALCLDAEASYLVTGGLRGFGLKSATWLASRGARHLVLVSRQGPESEESREAIAELQAMGVRVYAAACDVTDEQALHALLNVSITAMPPLKGVIHAAAVIEDNLIDNVSPAQLQRVLAPKVAGAYYLHKLTAAMPLDFFVLFSSATTLFGNPGQSSYVAANMAMEGLAQVRKQSGLPVTCVRWGAIDDVGFLARHEKTKEALEKRMGGKALQSTKALEALEQMLISKASGLGVLEFDWSAISRFIPTHQQPRYQELSAHGSSKGGDDGSTDILQLIHNLPDEASQEAVAQIIKIEVAEILRAAIEKIELSRPLFEMGFDSLMAVELSVAIERRLAVKLPVLALNEGVTIAQLAARLVTQARGVAQLAEGAPPPHHLLAREQVQQVIVQHAAKMPAEMLEDVAQNIVNLDATKKSRMIH